MRRVVGVVAVVAVLVGLPVAVWLLPPLFATALWVCGLVALGVSLIMAVLVTVAESPRDRQAAADERARLRHERARHAYDRIVRGE